MPELQCPNDRRHPLEIDSRVAFFDESFNGVVSCRDRHEYNISHNIIDLLPHTGMPGSSIANYSNNFTFTASVYENQWRKRSIGILSGQDFSMDDEASLMMSWIGDPSGKVILDIGTSTGFYARTISKSAKKAEVFALDISEPMLRQAIRNGKNENTGFYPLRADAARLPFFDDQVDVIVCGGTYNELYEPENVLREMRRVLKPEGICFMMYLTSAESLTGRLLQTGLAPGGVHFPKPKTVKRQFRESGFSSTKHRKLGIVNFELLKSVTTQ